ncbi:hypothetical protein BK126_19235 [Paenibacillus sp. FSL H7-0326]|uniref:DUF4179 domain-containing protein n=1 Tax=Paenibacillus sp. FSL H7-0326 TaxID=1921144 RepID=UPI00096E0798|nr:DUF4179 domain-containing protein [Paenibacillus sp. FSL H7-0326]OMC66164.1 hypothetical protein BK126_19235 [Paenibacillus sp. FSL H7-0326]
MSPHSINQEDEIKRISAQVRGLSLHKDFTEPIMSELYIQQQKRHPVKHNHLRRIKNRHKTWLLTSLSTAAGVILVASLFTSSSMAASLQQIPVLQSIFRLAGDLGLYRAANENLSDHPNAVASIGDITVTVPEVVYDGNRVSLSLIRAAGSSASMSLRDQISDIDIWVDDVNVQASESGNHIPIFSFPGADDNSAIIEFVDLGNQGGESFPDQFKLTLRLSMNGFSDPLSLSVPVTMTSGDHIEIEPSISKDDGDLTFSLKRIELTPITTNITTAISLPEGVAYDAITNGIAFDVLDESGNKLQTLTGIGRSDAVRNTFISDTRYQPFAEVPEKIIIRPYKYIYNDSSNTTFAKDENGNIIVEYLPQLDIEISLKDYL